MGFLANSEWEHFSKIDQMGKSFSNECGGPSDETGKTEVLCHSRCGTIKIPPCSKALSAEHRPKFCSPSHAMVAVSMKKS
jgi:hypothetical protein